MKTKKQNPAMYRQGDVAIERIASLAANLNPVPLEEGKVILAHGEVTGHHHAFCSEEAEKFIDEKGAEYFRIKGRHIDLRLPVIRQWKGQVLVQHPDEGIIEFSLADVEMENDQAHISGDFAMLKHDEHNAQGIPAGLYKGSGADGKVRQREYSPSEIRLVLD